MNKIFKDAKTLNNEIQAKKSELQALQQQMHSLPGYKFIHAVESSKTCFDSLFNTNEADLLVNEINDRDEPLTRGDILKIFIASGYEFNENHLDACYPDSNEVIREYYKYHSEK